MVNRPHYKSSLTFLQKDKGIQFLLLSIILILSCKSPTKITPENTQELADCSAPGLTYNQSDSTSCICIDNANWNVDSTTCVCDDYHSLSTDSSSCVLDTSSHDFIWEIDTLGVYGELWDITVINDNNIWVVGDIVDSNFTHYNAAHWDGDDWEIIDIETEYNGSMSAPILKSIFAFSENDIWVNSSYPKHGDGINWVLYHLDDLGLNARPVKKCWGTSSSNMYFACSEGQIINYNGNNFTIIEDGTGIDFTDIWGTSENNIWSCRYTIDEWEILYSNGNTWMKIYERDESVEYTTFPKNNILLSISSIWQDEHVDTLIAVGSWGVFHAAIDNSGYARWGFKRLWNLADTFTIGYPTRVRGRHYNDVFVVGQRGSILHFNGENWHQYIQFYLSGMENTTLRAIDFSENTTYIIGGNYIIKATNIY